MTGEFFPYTFFVYRRDSTHEKCLNSVACGSPHSIPQRRHLNLSIGYALPRNYPACTEIQNATNEEGHYSHPQGSQVDQGLNLPRDDTYFRGKVKKKRRSSKFVTSSRIVCNRSTGLEAALHPAEWERETSSLSKPPLS